MKSFWILWIDENNFSCQYITRFSIYLIWCDLLYFFSLCSSASEWIKNTHRILNKHANIVFFFFSERVYAYIISLQPMKHNYTTYVFSLLIFSDDTTYIHIGSDRIGGFIHVRFPIGHTTCKLTKEKCIRCPCAHHVCMLLYYNKNIINWLTMNTKYCIWVMFGILS